jgi:hypothetical protein
MRWRARRGLLLATCALLGVAGEAQALETTVPVSARANIFDAGRGSGPGFPTTVRFPAGGAKVLVVPGATGAAQGNCPIEPLAGPDGQFTPGSCTRTDVTSANGISGLIDSRAHMFMVGVFLTDAAAGTTAPRRLNFSPPPAGLGHRFARLAPRIGQSFFIGDGLTGTGTGVPHSFMVPPTATRLFLGIVEAFGFVGSPGAAGDNRGGFTAPVRVVGAPALGRRVAVEPVSGSVRISLPPARRSGGATAAQVRGRRFVPLRAERTIPVGSLVDTRRGTVRMTSARNRRGTTQTGDFSGGVFEVVQARRGSGRTDLVLKGGSFRRCGAGSSAIVNAARSRRRVRRLRGNASGRFRTRGRYASATVRGTDWTLTDRCDGTLTTVRRGSVDVRDFNRHRTVRVRAGRRYLARAPR